jgi:aspartyl-tRNA(Asn)/glutamyl-tRNA(Gln) amidotransferase subunit B
MTYEAVIGLEVHVQLKTRSKMFTRAAAGYGFPENTLTDPVVLALPGTLPVMNKEALDKIVKAGLMLGCEIAPVCKWDRKNYFYPDSPKNYQISQYDQPICRGGRVEIELPGAARNIMGEHKHVALTRIHLEEDVGKLNHGDGDSLVDFNRAGTPLMEIVSEPVIASADEAFAYLTALKAVMIYGGISDCDMEKGQLRCDANISIRPGRLCGPGHQGRAQEPELVRLRARRHRPRDQAPDRGRPGGRQSPRRRATTTARPASPSPCARRRWRTTTGISRTRT